jgi:pre-mRNA-splicing factor SPF27
LPLFPQIDALNRERKVQQMAAGIELRRLEDEWANAVRKNLEISMACEKLEAEVDALTAQLPQQEEGQQGQQQQQQQQQQQEGGSGDDQQGQQEQQQQQHGDGNNSSEVSKELANGQHTRDEAEPMDE